MYQRRKLFNLQLNWRNSVCSAVEAPKFALGLASGGVLGWKRELQKVAMYTRKRINKTICCHLFCLLPWQLWLSDRDSILPKLQRQPIDSPSILVAPFEECFCVEKNSQKREKMQTESSAVGSSPQRDFFVRPLNANLAKLISISTNRSKFAFSV